jgi:hypothetical protein
MLKRLAVWASPFVGGVATSTFLTLRCLAEGQTYSIASAFVVWLTRDTVIGYLIGLPTLFAIRRFGVVRVPFYVFATMVTAVPMGYILANPVTYAWTPTDQDFEHGPYWLLMCIYMACSGITGLVFSVGHRPTAHGSMICG